MMAISGVGNRLHTTSEELRPWSREFPPPKKLPRGQRWVKNKDIKPVRIPEDWELQSERSNSQDDPDHDVKMLTDWNGDWLPAPVEWEGRRSFSERNFYDRIFNWITHSWPLDESFTEITHQDLEIAKGDFAPRFWIPKKIDNESPQSFWAMHPERPPAPLSDIEPNEKPYWETYTSPTTVSLNPLTIPEAKVDPADECAAHERLDEGSMAACLKHKAEKEEKKLRRFRRMQDARKLLQEAPTEMPIVPWVPEDRSLNPAANIYVRPAYPIDMEQMKDILNWHIDHGVSCPEMYPREVMHVRDLIDTVVTAHLPFIVAVEKKARRMGKGLRGRMAEQETIVGFAYADDHHDPRGMYRFTVELEMYVRHQYFRNGVGSCLLDRMLYLLDPVYPVKGGYEFRCEDDPAAQAQFGPGGRRTVAMILCMVPYLEEDRKDPWVKKWLSKSAFHQVGDLPKIGTKLRSL